MHAGLPQKLATRHDDLVSPHATPYHAWYRVDHVIYGTELLRVRQQHMRHGQRAGFAIGAQSGILDGFKIDDMGETKNAADHLASAEAEHVGKQ